MDTTFVNLNLQTLTDATLLYNDFMQLTDHQMYIYKKYGRYAI